MEDLEQEPHDVRNHPISAEGILPLLDRDS